jgi:very-short-patch-repair endonuclease
METRRQLNAIARRQHDVVSARQLRELGMTRDATCGAIARGDLALVVPRLYAVGRDPNDLTLDGWAMASVLCRDSMTASSGVTAIMRYGAWDRGPAEIHAVTLGNPGRIESSCAPGRCIRVHRCGDLPGTDITLLRGVPTCVPIRACRELGRSLTPLQVTYVLREFVRRRSFSIDEFACAVDASGQFQGAPVIREAIRWYERGSAGTRGRNEDELCRLLAATTLPRALVNVRGATGLDDLEGDFTWCRERLVVELNDRSHLLPGAAEADAEKARRLTLVGYRVLFIPGWRVWKQPRAVISDIARGLGR